jgi:4-hydroxybenzoate polyprenyltransferase
MKLKAILNLLRVRQSSKQILVLVPLLVLGKTISINDILISLRAAIAFGFAAGFAYVINDLSDVQSDVLDKTKASRPYASGRISKQSMVFCGLIFLSIALLLTISFEKSYPSLLAIILIYVVINVCYSMFKLKRNRILGICLVGIGFPLRFMFGSISLGLKFSPWAFVLLFQLAIFMLSGKRYQTSKRKLIIENSNTKFTQNELDFWLLGLVSLGSLFTATYVGFALNSSSQLLWGANELLLSTIPVGLGILRYLEIVTHPEKYLDSDVTNNFLKDLTLGILGLIFVIILMFGRISSP